MNPRILGSRTIASLLEHLTSAVSGQEGLRGALENLKQDGNFRVVSDLPVMPLLKSVGMLSNVVDGKRQNYLSDQSLPRHWTV